MSDIPPWYGVWTLPAWEKRVFRALHDLELCPYLPRDRETVIRRGRKVDIEYPMFPGYCFLQPPNGFSHYEQAATIDVEGVGGILRNGGLPVAIPYMQLANRLYADILDAIRQSEAKNMFSRRKWKKEIKFQQHLARLRAA